MNLIEKIKKTHKSNFGPLTGTLTGIIDEWSLDTELTRFCFIILTLLGPGLLIYPFLYFLTKEPKWRFIK